MTAQNSAYKGASAPNRFSTPAWFRGALALMVLVIAARPAESQSQAGSDGGQPVENVDRLSRQDYADRQQATLEMWKRRDDFRDTVQRAARHRDPEIAGRANWILRQWRRGALPDTPPQISRLLQQSDHPEAVDRLLEAGQFAAAVVAVEESAGTIDHESIQRRATAALLRRFPIYVHLAIEHEALRELLQLVDLVAVSPAMALTRIQLMQQLGMPVGEDAILPAAANAWPAIERDRTTVMLLAWLGRLDEAVAVAQASGDEKLLLRCRMVAQQWEQIAQDSAAAAGQAEPGSISHARLWSQTLMAADRSGKERLLAQAIEALSPPPQPQPVGEQQNPDQPGSEQPDRSVPGTAENAQATELRWKTLASHGHVQPALQILDRTSPDTAATLAMHASRIEHSFETLGYPLERIDQDCRLWAKQAIEAQSAAGAQQFAPEFRNVTTLLQCLLSIGRDQPAWMIAKELCESESKIGNYRLREYVLPTLARTPRAGWVIRLAVGQDEDQLAPISHDTVARALPDADSSTLEMMLEAMTQLYPSESFRFRFQAACELIQGNIPAGFDESSDFQRLYDFLIRPRITRVNRATMQPYPLLRANLNSVKMFARQGQTQYALACLEQLARSGQTEAMLSLAQQSLDTADTEAAIPGFEAVLNQIRHQRQVGAGDDVVLAAKATVGLWMAAKRRNETELAASLLDEIRLMLCSPSSHTRFALASHLAELGETSLAMEAYHALLPIKVFIDDDSIDLYKVARAYALVARQSDPREAARWFDLALTRAIESDEFNAGAFVTLPLYVRRWLIEASLAEGLPEETRQHVERLLELDPQDIDLAERLLPKMRQAGMDDLANETLDRILDAGLKHFNLFPLDAVRCNNLAWIAAVSKRRLDDALQLSQRAVYLQPESAVYRDTLAEVLFLRGETQAAIHIEQGCLLDDPGQWHLHQQLARFSK